MTSIVRAWQIVDGGVLANMPVRLPEPGPTEVVVRVGAVALNHRDLLVRAGRYGRAVPVGAVPCSDAAGVIAAVGTRVDRVAVGDRVTTVVAPDWHAGTLTRATLLLDSHFHHDCFISPIRSPHASPRSRFRLPLASSVA